MIWFLSVLVIVITILAGFYPAVILSKYDPALVLKNQHNVASGSTRKAFLRKTFTVTQFVIAQFFVIATVITVKQIHYMLNKDLGFKKEGIIYFAVPYNNGNNHPRDSTTKYVLLNEMNAISGIELISVGYGPPCSEYEASTSFTYKDGKKEILVSSKMLNGDTNYLKLYHIRLLAGRSPQQDKVVKEYVINETLMHVLGFQNPRDAINKILNGHRIVGVMADFNQASLHAQIKPEAFEGDAGNGVIFHVALKPQAFRNILVKDHHPD